MGKGKVTKVASIDRKVIPIHITCIYIIIYLYNIYDCWCICRIISPLAAQIRHHDIKSCGCGQTKRCQIQWPCWIQSILKPDRPIPCGSRTTFSKAQWPSISQLIYDITIEWDKRAQVLKTSTPHPASITTIGTFHLMWGPFLGYWIIYRFVSGLLKHVWVCTF